MKTQKKHESGVATDNWPDLLTVAQAAARLSLSRTAVYELCSSKQLEHFCLGAGNKGIRIEARELDAFIERRRQRRRHEPTLSASMPAVQRRAILLGELDCLPLPKALRN